MVLITSGESSSWTNQTPLLSTMFGCHSYCVRSWFLSHLFTILITFIRNNYHYYSWSITIFAFIHEVLRLFSIVIEFNHDIYCDNYLIFCNLSHLFMMYRKCLWFFMRICNNIFFLMSYPGFHSITHKVKIIFYFSVNQEKYSYNES